MPLVRSGETTIYFAHCPKAGGTSVEHYLESRFGMIELIDRRWDDVWKNIARTRPMIKSSPQHMRWEDACRILESPPTHVFTVVRDPVRRMVSEYNFHAAASHRRRRRVAQKLGFSAWLHMVLASYRHAPHIFDNHLRPQVEFFPSDAQVFRLEDGFDPLVKWLDEIAPETRGPHRFEHKQKSRIDRVSTIKEEDRALIEKVYATDFGALGYPRSGSPKRRGLLWPASWLAASVSGAVLARAYDMGKI